MADPEIAAFGRRILSWVERMRPLSKMTESAFANRKNKEEHKENDNDRDGSLCDDVGGNDGPM